MAIDNAERGADAWRGGLILFSVCVAAVSLTIDLTIIGVALDPIGRSLDASFAALQFLIGAYNVPFAALLLISGVLADRYGRLKLFIAGNVLFALFALFAGLSASMETLNTWRALQGLGAAMIMPACSALIAHGFQSTLTPGAPDLTVFIGMALAGSGVGIVHAVNDNLAVSTAPPGKSGVAAGMLHTMRLSTETVAIIAAGAVMVTLTLGQLQATLPGISEDAARLVARADIAGAAALLPDADARAFTVLATETSAEALRLVLMGLGAVAILCAVLAALLIRQRDILSPTDEDKA